MGPTLVEARPGPGPVRGRSGGSGGSVGYITYGHEKMYLTALDAERMGKGRRLSVKQANRSAFVFAYPCH